MSNINKIMEAYLGMVSDRDSELEEGRDKSQPKKENKKLDPVDDKENDKEFKDREDKDIDNDGDVDSSDEYLHKKRKATSDAMKGQVDEVSADLAKAASKASAVDINSPDTDSKDKSDKDVSKTPSQKYADYKREGGKLSMDDWKKRQHESTDSLLDNIDTSESFESMWEEIIEAANPKKDAHPPEKYDDHSSKHDKEVIAKHKKSEKKYEDDEEDGHDKTFSAAKAVKKQAPARSSADNLSIGDKSVVNPVKGK